MKKRIISLFLATVISVSLFAFSAPVAGAYDHAPVPSQFNVYSNALIDFVISTYKLASGGVISSVDINSIASRLKFPRVGKVSYEGLKDCVECYNASLYGKMNALIGGNKFQSRGAIRPDFNNGIYRIYDHAVGSWVVDANGDFPYALMEENAGDVPAGAASDKEGACRWLSASGSEITNKPRFYSRSVLDAKALQLTEWGHPCQLEEVTIGPAGKGIKCWAIRDDYWYYYCDEDGNRLVTTEAPTITEVERPAVDSDGDLVEGDNGLTLDVENGVLNLIGQLGDKHELSFDGVVFDFGDKLYTVNAYTTNIEGDEYHYTYYTYNIQYNITNTYITYIGSNEPYEREEYELYYQLPDGRSSADLTAEEVAGMSFEFYDVVNYARSATDISVRGLYHFDGNLEDSSYFTAPDRFVWDSGASLTYMESPSAFGGNLYLDNNAHSFTIHTPSNFASGDFTIQFRYYQASEPDTLSNFENYFNIGGTTGFLVWDEQVLKCTGGGQTSLPVGTWNEIALVRHNGVVYSYLNGLCFGSGSWVNPLANWISFEFGSTSRAYSMLDELRILNFALVENGVSYAPTVVPHDSNLVLVLPDSDRPSADEYLDIESSYTNLLGDTHNYLNGGNTSHFHPVSISSVHSVMTSGITGYALPEFMYRSGSVYSLSAQQNSVFLTRSTGKDPYVTEFGSIATNQENVYFGFGIRLSPTGSNGIVPGRTYTFSLVHEDGTVDKLTFSANSTYFNTSYYYSSFDKLTTLASASFSWGQLFVRMIPYTRNESNLRYCSYPMLCIAPNAGQSVDVAYLELVEGSASDIKLVTKTAVYKGDEIEPNTAAIQTEIPVNGYTVGGVRPSLPSRGDCWFPVMNNRITSVQIYTGTHWEEVNARWWTGSRWIPISAFDINTLEDLFDIADGDTTVPLLPDQNSFLRWWQLQWLDFRQWLENTLSNVGGGGGTSLPDDDTLPGDEGDGWSFVDLLIQTKDGLWKITKGVVKTAAGGITGLVLLINDAGSFFDPFQAGHTDGVMDLFNYGGDDIWD